MLNYTIGAVRKTAKKKGRKGVTPTCRAAGSARKTGKTEKVRSKASAILAMCKAVAEGKKLSPAATKRYKVTRAALRKRK